MGAALADVIVVTQCRAKGEVYVMEDTNMDQRLPSGSTVLVLSTESATGFPKTRWKSNSFSSRHLLEGNQGREETKGQAALPVQTKHRHCPAAPHTLQALLERAAGREGVAVSSKAPRELLCSPVGFTLRPPACHSWYPEEPDVDKIQQSFYVHKARELRVKSHSSLCI